MKNYILWLLSLITLIIPCQKVSSKNNEKHDLQIKSCYYCKETLLKKVRETGSIRVIVTLDIDYTPEHELTDSKSITKQRKMVKDNLESIIHEIRNKDLNFTDIQASRTGMSWFVVSADEEALSYLFELPLVRKIEIDELLKPLLNESTSIIRADYVWETLGFTGEGQTIAIIDTGVDYEHDFLSDRVVDGACFSTNSINSISLCPNGEKEQYGVEAGIDCSSNINGCGHGTHVAGIAAGKATDTTGINVQNAGVAPGANIISIQVFSRYEGYDCYAANMPSPCALTSFANIRDALKWIYNIRNNYNITAVNMSLGGGEYTSPCDTYDMKVTIDNLASVGITTIAASGNNGFDDAMSTPACISSVISVGATLKNVLDTHWSGSNAADFLDLTAPGVNIWSAWSSTPYLYTAKTGTSMAAPHVAGTVALLKSVNPDLTPAQIRTILHNSADKPVGMGGSNHTNEYGYGRVNAYQALLEGNENCPPQLFANKKITSNLTINNCQSILRNVRIARQYSWLPYPVGNLTINSEIVRLTGDVILEDNSKLTINANEVTIHGEFEAKLGTELVIE